MSTVKTDAITAVSTNGDLSLDGLGTGGVSIASTLKMTKGGDISSASPLVIDVDGNYFDVTGTTNFSAMTVESGNFFMLQFDGALTITHGSGIELPGAANLTTATGDRLICYATAANTVEVMSVETEAAAVSGWTEGTEQATTSGDAVTVTGLPSGIRAIKIILSKLSTDGVGDCRMSIGDAGGLETSGYTSCSKRMVSTTVGTGESTEDFICLTNNIASHTYSGVINLWAEDQAGFEWVCNGILHGDDSAAGTFWFGGGKTLSAEITQFSLYVSDTFDGGAFQYWTL